VNTPNITLTSCFDTIKGLRAEIERLQTGLRAIAEGDVHGDTVYDDWFDAVQVIEKFARETLGVSE
jgi:predicted aminopeptidase